ncbi:MAG TPA: alpha/beta hydrolase [Acidimicrobiales bacterium]|nr:alpha/beta hydrolase [Acidimicrobiales bacterium]
MTTRGWEAIEGPCGSLMVHLAAGGPSAGGMGSAPPGPSSAVVLVHDFPAEEASAGRTGRSLPVLADRVASESGWRVLAGCLRGVGGSSGEFSLCGWMDDLEVLAGRAADMAAGGGVWLVGFGVGGSLSLAVAAHDARIRGVGCLGSPATFADWGHDPASMLEAARRVGVVHSQGFPFDVTAWAAEFSELRPVEAAASLGQRPLLLVHGADDDDVPVSDARQLAEAAGSRAELHVLPGAGHRLRADPRAMALLVGWLERQGP